MDNATENSFCLPCDQASGKNSLTVMPEFRFIRGNLTKVPECHSTGWRTMPFHLCTMGIRPKGASSLLEIKGQKSILGVGNDFLFIPAGIAHRFTETGKGKRQSLWIHFSSVALGGFDIFSLYETKPLYLTDPQDVEHFRKLLMMLIKFPKYQDPWKSLRFQIAGIHLAGDILQRFPEKEMSQSSSTNILRLQPVLNRLSTADSLPTTQELAEMIYLSPSRFLAVFHEVLNTTPRRYWETIRHTRACEMVLKNMSIGEIADKLGYADLFHFSRSFKKIEGISPRQYRQVNLNRETPSRD